jgi:hypothetical protein
VFHGHKQPFLPGTGGAESEFLPAASFPDGFSTPFII